LLLLPGTTLAFTLLEPTVEIPWNPSLPTNR
jgi:hypothetical protein